MCLDGYAGEANICLTFFSIFIRFGVGNCLKSAGKSSSLRLANLRIFLSFLSSFIHRWDAFHILFDSYSQLNYTYKLDSYYRIKETKLKPLYQVPTVLSRRVYVFVVFIDPDNVEH